MASRSKPTSGPVGRDWKVAVVIGLVTGQLGYLYTRQPKRLAMSLLLAVLALALSMAACYTQLPPMSDPELMLQPEWMGKVTAALWLPTLVSILNNVACAVDLYLQVKQAN
ncbi:MAG: hypothetical protein JWM80_536 [Cyanobacteria bacterium RYN_339]|nr:hypothetical protein [Cyanobacteria bacterium RYN_339]